MMIEGKDKNENDMFVEEQTKILAARFPAIKDTVIASLINNFGIDEAIVILEKNPALKDVLEEISKRKIPDTDNIQ